MKNGLQHKDRIKPALDGTYFKVDENTLDDLINFSIKFSRLINFYNLENNLEGDASVILEDNIEVLIIQISSIDIAKLNEHFEESIQRIRVNPEEVSVVLKKFYEIFESIESWNKKSEDETEFNREIDQTIDAKFKNLLAKVRAFEDELRKLDLYDGPVKTLEYASKHEWRTNVFQYEDQYFSVEAENLLADKIADECLVLFNAISESLQLLIQNTEKYIDVYLNAGMTQPHIALFIAFVEMYKEAQYEINQFTERHLQYFYREILKLSPRPEVPDRVDLLFSLQDGIDRCRITKGTLLSGGIDQEGNDIFYALDDELVVGKANVDALRAIINDPDSQPQPSEVFESVYIHHNVNEKLYEEDQEEGYELGFVLATSFLKLKEGDRHIKLILEFQRQGFDEFIRAYEAGVDASVLNIDEFTRDLFSFGYSTHNEEDPEIQEWFQVPDENVESKLLKGKEGNVTPRFEIEIDVEALFPPIEACIDPRFPQALENEIPVCKLLIENSKLAYYNYFKLLVIDKVHMSVAVEGVQDLHLQNDFGLLDSSAPFEPFGATPAINSTFYIGHETIFSQKLDRLEIALEWHDLPLTTNGFPEYYEGYSSVDSNEVFKAKLSFLKGKKWYPEENKQVINLFRDGDVDPETGDIDVDIYNLIDTIDLKDFNFHFQGAPVINNSEAYDRSAKNGFLRLEFANPVTAFGHKEYTLIMNNANSRRGESPLPNAPWTPSLKAISINYSASFTLDLQNQDRNNKSFVYHIHPFGEKIVSEPVGQHVHVMPVYPHGTEIILAISDFDPLETLSLYIHIDEFSSMSLEADTHVSWSYLNRDSWVDISYDQIIQDTTLDLTHSGVIIFDFPGFDREYFNESTFAKNKSYPGGFFWLKCSSKLGAELCEKITLVKAQAATATFLNQGNSPEHLAKPLPAQTVNSFVEDLPEIREILQPYPSYNGVREENEENFKIRVSERLRHKERAITTWDYEHLVLDNFPGIHKVICLNNINSQLQNQPGNVLIVLIPLISEAFAQAKVLEPRNNLDTIARIKDLLKSRVSPFVTVDVVNPIYEHVQVKFDVKFHDGLNERYYLQKVNEDLKAFLNPWKFGEGQVDLGDTNIEFGSRIYAMHIIYFLEKLDYIDYIANLSVFHILDGLIINLDSASDYSAYLEPQTQISIFISAEDHIANLVGSEEKVEALGAMMIGKDFTAENLIERQGKEGVAFDQVGINAGVNTEEKKETEERKYIIKFKGFFRDN